MQPTDREQRPPASDGVPEWMLWCDREIRRQPLTALTVATATGFVLGGGLRSRVGRGLILIAGRSLIGSAVYGFMAGLVEDDDNREHNAVARGTGSGAK